jgi:deoxyribodipyrimidine photolyase-related protein
MRPTTTTIWIFEDQLTPSLSLLKTFPDAPVLMIESAAAFSRWKYHKKRLTFLISAMRHFRDELRAAGRVVDYHELKPRGYRDSLSAIKHHLKTFGAGRTFHIVRPNDFHTREWARSLEKSLGIRLEESPNELFLVDLESFGDWARSVKSPVMETFYRRMRARHRVLMDDGKPAGGAWNFDKLNRKPPPGGLLIPAPPAVKPDAITLQVMREVERRFADHPGSTDGFDYPVTRAGAAGALSEFLDLRLAQFGDYEDAMLTGQPLLYHSRLSSALNAGLLSPLQCTDAAEERYRNGRAPLNAVEGFVRQILGWREYMYGIYQTFMPGYRDRNAHGDTRPLPAFFWSGDTDLNCLKQTIATVLDKAYSHHIQRLMVICNFALLAGLDPQAMADWFLEMYVDSHDWVVTPNVIGMAMNADGGTCATKPYVSSAAYINKMSDYCGACRYDPKSRVGPEACPFNFLYWNFLESNRPAMEKNPRMNMLVKNLDRFGEGQLVQMRVAKKVFLERLNPQ